MPNSLLKGDSGLNTDAGVGTINVGGSGNGAVGAGDGKGGRTIDRRRARRGSPPSELTITLLPEDEPGLSVGKNSE